MNNIELFKNESFGEIRTLLINAEVWFIGKDVAEALGYKNTRDALSKHIDIEDKTDVAIYDGSQNRNMIIINESGLYSLILSSKLPQAKEFKRWITNEVLPTIRKTGTYTISKNKDTSNLEEMKIKAQLERAEAMKINAEVRKFNAIMKVTNNKNLSPVAVEVFGLRAIEKVIGKNLEQYLPKVDKTYSATEIGKILGISSNRVGILANEHNLKTEENGVWVMDKSKHSNKEVSTFRYYENAIDKFRMLVV